MYSKGGRGWLNPSYSNLLSFAFTVLMEDVTQKSDTNVNSNVMPTGTLNETAESIYVAIHTRFIRVIRKYVRVRTYL